MHSIKLLSFLILFLFISMSTKSQVAPATLSAGLAAVTGSKGSIDVELLAEIVSQKQDELKKEILQRNVLRAMNGKSFAMKNYAYSSFSALMTFKDKKAIEKELLKQVSILSLQVGVAETLLQLSFLEAADQKARPSDEISRSIENFIEIEYSTSKVHAREATNMFINKTKTFHFMLLYGMDDLIRQCVVEATGIKISEKDFDQKKSFSAILLDCVFEVCRRKNSLQELGFVQINPNLRPTYQENNLFVANESDWKDLELLVTQSVGVLVDYHPLFHKFINEKGLSINDICSLTEGHIMSADSMSKALMRAKSFIGEVSLGLSELLGTRSISSADVDILMTELTAVQQGLNEFEIRKKSTATIPIVQVTMSDYGFMIRHIDPLVNKMIALGILTDHHVLEIERIKSSIYASLVERVKDDINSKSTISNLDNFEIAHFSHLLQLITSLSELDKVGSYEHIFNTLAQIGLNQTRKSELKLIRELTYFVDAFTSINLKEQVIHVEVEELLIKLLGLYENQVSSTIEPYFGVGLNQTFDIAYNGQSSQLLNSDGGVITDLGFASEKLGLKVKLLNNKKLQAMDASTVSNTWQSFFRGKNAHINKSPIVSDVYLFAYGGGLLYNVADLTTEGDGFDAVLVGGGLGIAFFNSLDINIWRTSPLVGNGSLGDKLADRGFYGISFDIKLAEYLSALSKKRNMRKFE